MKDEILKLKEKGYTGKQIAEELGCAKSTVSYHITNEGYESNKIKESTIAKVIKFYKTHTAEETSKKFSISKTSVKKYGEPKRVFISNEEKRKRCTEAGNRRRRKIKEKAIEYKGGSCVKCGYNKCNSALEFHHSEPNEKDFSIGKKGYCTSWEKVKKELDKCILVCSNCHREIHELLISAKS